MASPRHHHQQQNRRRWSGLSVPIFVALVVFAEIAFLGRLDFAVVENWTNSFYFPPFQSQSSTSNPNPNPKFADPIPDSNVDVGKCRDWLEREDAVPHARDFKSDPVVIAAADQDWDSCTVGCKFGMAAPGKTADATFMLPGEEGKLPILRSMESSHYYAENNIELARRRGYKIIMTTSLSSDVPVGYFSWAEYDIMAPLVPKMVDALAAAFISNRGARNFRLQSLEVLEKLNVKIDSYGSCHRNHDGRGAIPVVVGAPNIQDFAPSPSSVLPIKELSDATSVAKTMKYLASNPHAFNKSISLQLEI